MKSNVRLGRVLGIEIGLHYSWFIIALLITLSLAGHFAMMHPGWGPTLIWGLAVAASLLFFASLLAHEMGHSLWARSHGIPVRSIVLFALGGVSQIEHEASDPRTEFWLGLIGPLVSLFIGSACLGLAAALGWAHHQMTPAGPFMAVLVWLGYINVVVGAFNLVPGYPLDGGRILRAALWWKSGDPLQATRQAAGVGQIVAGLIIALGVFGLLTGGGLASLWPVFIGWFLLEAGQASRLQVQVQAELRGITAREVMRRDCPVVEGRLSLLQFVERQLLPQGRRCFVVQHNGVPEGVITPDEVKRVEQPRWPYTSVEQAMQPIERLPTVSPDAPLVELLERMQRDGATVYAVEKDGTLTGLVTRDAVREYLQTRAELRMGR